MNFPGIMLLWISSLYAKGKWDTRLGIEFLCIIHSSIHNYVLSMHNNKDCSNLLHNIIIVSVSFIITIGSIIYQLSICCKLSEYILYIILI